MNDIRKEMKDQIQKGLVSIDEAVKAFETLAISLNDCHFDNDKWNSAPLARTKPYFRMKEKW